MSFTFLDIVSLCASIISITGNCITIMKLKKGYLFCITADIIMCLMFIFLQTNYYMAALQFVYICLCSYGYYRWSQDEKTEERCMYDIDGTLFSAVDWTRKWLAKRGIHITVRQWADKYFGKSIKYILNDNKDKLTSNIDDLIKDYEFDFHMQLQDINTSEFRINFTLLDKIKYSRHRCLINTGRNKEQAEDIIRFLGIKPSIVKMFYGKNKLQNIPNIVRTWNIKEVYEDMPKYIEEFEKLKVKCYLVKSDYNYNANYKNIVEFK